ncbi:MAG: hypothetical protein IKO07_13740 [Clostridia bacterium]|nr:hypothetical protein [Clostridia bacterium]
MKPDGRDIKRALDARLSALDADPARRARVRRLIEKEEEPVKRKMTLSLACALIAALALAGVAWAAGVNVFEYFAAQDARLAPIAEGSAPATQTPLSVKTNELGESSIRFDSAYYDGQNLLVGIVIGNASRAEPFEPTAEELAGMEKTASNAMPVALIDGEDAPALAAFNEAVAQGKPCGYAQYTVYPSDHVTTGEGADVGAWVQLEGVSGDGDRLLLREMETPLPEAIQNLDELELHMKIWQDVSYCWFDGETLYTRSERVQAGEAVCTVTRSEAAFVTYAGEGEYGGVPVSLTLSLSALHGKLSVEAAGDAFPAGPDHDIWYDVILTDENGVELRELENGMESNRIDASYYGLGYLPEMVTAYIVIETEGDWDRDAAMRSARPIDLRKAE